MGHAIVAGGKPDMAAPVTDILASDLAVGSVVKLMENGVATEYLVVNHGKPSGSSLYDDSCDGTWLLRKDVYGNRQLNSTDNNSYGNSTMHTYLNGTFYNMFGSTEKSVIKQVKIPYVNIAGGTNAVYGENGLSTKVFLLSCSENGSKTNSSDFPENEGAVLDYFIGADNSKRIAYYNGSIADWWTRSPSPNGAPSTAYSWAIIKTGAAFSGVCFTAHGFRPSIVILNNSVFSSGILTLKGVS